MTMIITIYITVIIIIDIIIITTISLIFLRLKLFYIIAIFLYASLRW